MCYPSYMCLYTAYQKHSESGEMVTVSYENCLNFKNQKDLEASFCLYIAPYTIQAASKYQRYFSRK